MENVQIPKSSDRPARHMISCVDSFPSLTKTVRVGKRQRTSDSLEQDHIIKRATNISDKYCGDDCLVGKGMIHLGSSVEEGMQMVPEGHVELSSCVVVGIELDVSSAGILSAQFPDAMHEGQQESQSCQDALSQEDTHSSTANGQTSCSSDTMISHICPGEGPVQSSVRSSGGTGERGDIGSVSAARAPSVSDCPLGQLTGGANLPQSPPVDYSSYAQVSSNDAATFESDHCVDSGIAREDDSGGRRLLLDGTDIGVLIPVKIENSSLGHRRYCSSTTSTQSAEHTAALFVKTEQSSGAVAGDESFCSQTQTQTDDFLSAMSAAADELMQERGAWPGSEKETGPRQLTEGAGEEEGVVVEMRRPEGVERAGGQMEAADATVCERGAQEEEGSLGIDTRIYGGVELFPGDVDDCWHQEGDEFMAEVAAAEPSPVVPVHDLISSRTRGRLRELQEEGGASGLSQSSVVRTEKPKKVREPASVAVRMWWGHICCKRQLGKFIEQSKIKGIVEVDNTGTPNYCILHFSSLQRAESFVKVLLNPKDGFKGFPGRRDPLSYQVLRAGEKVVVDDNEPVDVERGREAAIAAANAADVVRVAVHLKKSQRSKKPIYSYLDRHQVGGVVRLDLSVPKQAIIYFSHSRHAHSFITMMSNRSFVYAHSFPGLGKRPFTYTMLDAKEIGEREETGNRAPTPESGGNVSLCVGQSEVAESHASVAAETGAAAAAPQSASVDLISASATASEQPRKHRFTPVLRPTGLAAAAARIGCSSASEIVDCGSGSGSAESSTDTVGIRISIPLVSSVTTKRVKDYLQDRKIGGVLGCDVTIPRHCSVYFSSMHYARKFMFALDNRTWGVRRFPGADKNTNPRYTIIAEDGTVIGDAESEWGVAGARSSRVSFSAIKNRSREEVGAETADNRRRNGGRDGCLQPQQDDGEQDVEVRPSIPPPPSDGGNNQASSPRSNGGWMELVLHEFLS
jgi:hypothetical protein